DQNRFSQHGVHVWPYRPHEHLVIVLGSPLQSGSEITLPFGKNRFEIEFSALSYSSAYRNEYLYKLDGIDANWSRISGKNPLAIYSLLPSGRYRFKVKAANNDGVWNNAPIYLDVYVKSDVLNSKMLKVVIVSLIILIPFLITGVLIGRQNRKALRKPQKTEVVIPEIDSENKEKLVALEVLMKSEKLYLDPDLRLSNLANKIDVSSNHLSMLLNDYVGLNFYDYVNYYRVEEVKKRLMDLRYQHQTISSIGGDCGFNSKSAFYRIFKNVTGKTPSQYQKEVEAKVN
ncbi:helix-turn-helix domain-containing protein, partial [Snuella lapsa]|uniref:helix-turn-helix domain-containing protein n=1 Tax=Snuella lapsa TaxID=870481 RepID=UPI0031ECB82F